MRTRPTDARRALLFPIVILWLTATACSSTPDLDLINGGASDGSVTAAIVAGNHDSVTPGAGDASQGGTSPGNDSEGGAIVSGTESAAAQNDSAESSLQHYSVTDPGCCPMPFWSPDSAAVMFFSEPADGPSGLYAVRREGGPPAYVGGEPLGTQLAGRFTTQLAGEAITLTRTTDDHLWLIETDGAMLTLSADGARAAWVEGVSNTVPGQRQPPGTNRVLDLETGEIENVEVPEGYLLGDWTAQGNWILTRQDRESDLPMLVHFDLTTGETSELFDGARLRTGRTSPGRSWIAISRTFEDDPAKNGLYVLSTDGAAAPRRLDISGGYYWRDDDRLLVVPQEPGAASMALWQVDAATGTAEQLSDSQTMPFRIAAGEWAVSPDGSHVAYRSAEDDAIWVMRLPE